MRVQDCSIKARMSFPGGGLCVDRIAESDYSQVRFSKGALHLLLLGIAASSLQALAPTAIPAADTSVYRCMQCNVRMISNGEGNVCT